MSPLMLPIKFSVWSSKLQVVRIYASFSLDGAPSGRRSLKNKS
jgi:hypothetical protein